MDEAERKLAYAQAAIRHPFYSPESNYFQWLWKAFGLPRIKGAPPLERVG